MAQPQRMTWNEAERLGVVFVHVDPATSCEIYPTVNQAEKAAGPGGRVWTEVDAHDDDDVSLTHLAPYPTMVDALGYLAERAPKKDLSPPDEQTVTIIPLGDKAQGHSYSSHGIAVKNAADKAYAALEQLVSTVSQGAPNKEEVADCLALLCARAGCRPSDLEAYFPQHAYEERP